MSTRGTLIGVLSLVACVGAVGGFLTRGDNLAAVQRPPAETVLVGAPAVDRLSSRELFLKDPAGQVDRIAAADQLVAWTVRTPAAPIDGEQDREQPRVLPKATKVVVFDERTLQRMTVSYPGQEVTKLWFFHDSTGEARLAVRTCGSQRAQPCLVELMTLSRRGGVHLLSRRQTPAGAWVEGLVDRGQRLTAVATPRGDQCRRRLSVVDVADGKTQRLPALPRRAAGYPDCRQIRPFLLLDHYAFAIVEAEDRARNLSADLIYGYDLLAGDHALWHHVRTPYSASDGSTEFSVGPAVTADSLIWESFSSEEEARGLGRGQLPAIVQHDGQGGGDASSGSVAGGTLNVCDIAATEVAVYELTNPRCSAYGVHGSGGARIRRVVNPEWAREPDR